MSATQRETVEMIIHKIHRITTGDPNFEDHWVDIRDYADLEVRILRGEYMKPGELLYGREEGN